LYRSLPTRLNLSGILLALVAILLMAFDEVRNEAPLEAAHSEGPESKAEMTEAG
jgi:hypothetical protein